jgi:hypothetical protein
MNSRYEIRGLCSLLLLLCVSTFAPSIHGENKVLGEVELVGASKVENTSGVWVDGQYVGYLSELKGSKKLHSFPGNTRLPCARAVIWILRRR